jgi:hypothetical protein
MRPLLEEVIPKPGVFQPGEGSHVQPSWTEIPIRLLLASLVERSGQAFAPPEESGSAQDDVTREIPAPTESVPYKDCSERCAG